MSLFVKIYAATIYILAALAFVAGMYLLSIFSKAMIAIFGFWFLPPWLLFFLWISIKLEKAEQKRTGIKRPLFRFNND